jgi:hypothetical protein
MPVTKENGHVWLYSYQGDRCIHCSRRIEHYNEFKKSVESWDIDDPRLNKPEIMASLLICDSIVDKEPKNSDYIEPVGWGTYNHLVFIYDAMLSSADHNVKHHENLLYEIKYKYEEIPQKSFYSTYKSGILTEVILINNEEELWEWIV